MLAGEKFHFISQIHYDAFGDIIGAYVQKKLIEFGLKEVRPRSSKSDEDHLIINLIFMFPFFFLFSFVSYYFAKVWLPLDEKDASAPRVNIFLSDDALTNPERLLLIIQGSGAVR